MKKRNIRKFIFLILIVFVLFMGGFLGIRAASKYYEHKWTNIVKDIYDYDDYITNDVLKIDDGFIAIGFENVNYNASPSIRVLSEEGELKKEIVVDEISEDVQLKRIVKFEDGYGVLGVFAYDIYGILLSKDLEVVDVLEFNTSNDYGYTTEVYLEEDENCFYIFSDEFISGVDGVSSVVRFNKTEKVIGEVLEENYDDNIKNIILNYSKIWDYEGYNEKEYYPVFVKKYNDGFIYGLSLSKEDTSDYLLVYYKDGKEIWAKELENVFYRDAIDVYDNLLLAGMEYDDTTKEFSSFLLLVDEEFNNLSKDSIDNYLGSNAKIFWPEHLINVGTSGFALTGSVEYEEVADDSTDTSNEIVDGQGVKLNNKNEDTPPKGPKQEMENGEPPLLPDGTKPPEGAKPEDAGGVVDAQGVPDAKGESVDSNNSYNAQVLYYNIIHQVYTKTDGNGKVEATKLKAGWGETIEFVVTPNEGYVLDVIKVTDSAGNVVLFTDNTFIMPNADVTIEVSFKVENPETIVFISGIIIMLFVGSIFVVLKIRKKIV